MYYIMNSISIIILQTKLVRKINCIVIKLLTLLMQQQLNKGKYIYNNYTLQIDLQ